MALHIGLSLTTMGQDYTVDDITSEQFQIPSPSPLNKFLRHGILLNQNLVHKIRTEKSVRSVKVSLIIKWKKAPLAFLYTGSPIEENDTSPCTQCVVKCVSFLDRSMVVAVLCHIFKTGFEDLV